MRGRVSNLAVACMLSEEGQDIHFFEKKSSSGRGRIAQMKTPEKKLIFLRQIDYNRKYHVLL